MKNKYTLFILAVACTLTSCSEDPLYQYSNLDGPNASTIVRGEVCIQTSVEKGVIVGSTYACKPNETGNIALVTNGNSDSLVIIDLFPSSGSGNHKDSATKPRFLDTNPSIPGVTHLPVGRHPIDVAASPNGRAVYTLNQLSRSISIVDLLNLSTNSKELRLPAVPQAFDTTLNGEIVTIYANSDTLTIHQGASCNGQTTNACTLDETSVKTLILPGRPSDLALLKSVSNKEHISDKLNNNNNLAFVSYQNLPYISLIALDDDALNNTNLSCLDSPQPPCRVDDIPLTYGCNDGIDNDGDGLVDKDDPQCLSAYDSEAGWNDPTYLQTLGQPTDLSQTPETSLTDAIGGPSREVRNTCNDGLDNNQNGLTDKDDPNCVSTGGLSELVNYSPAVITACQDGIDNNGDGLIDLQDPGCYYPGTNREELPVTLGFQSISIDPTGNLLWILDRTNQQVLVVDAVRRKLIDAPKAASTHFSRDPNLPAYQKNLGINIPGSPLSLTTATHRRKIYDSKTQKYTGAETTYQALVASDNGFVYNVTALTLSCSQPTSGSIDLDQCTQIPEFPLQPVLNKKSCEQSSAKITPNCSCYPDNEACACELPNVTDFIQSRLYCTDSTAILATPFFSILDDSKPFASVPDVGQCTLPESMISKAVAFSQENRVQTNNPASCDSPIIPQPRALRAPNTKTNNGELVPPANIDLAAIPRADIATQLIPTFRSDRPSEINLSQSLSTKFIENERWKIRFQAELPYTKRSNWILPSKLNDQKQPPQSPPLATVSLGLDLCASNVQPGDIFELITPPNNKIESCGEFAGEPSKRRYNITHVTPQQLTISPIPNNAPLPTREQNCFPPEVTAVVRAKDSWIIERQNGTYYSSQMAQAGMCVPSPISNNQDSRLKTGESFLSPGVSFKIFSGYINPEEDLEYIFDSISRYEPQRYRPREGSGFANAGYFPYSVSFREFGNNDIAAFILTDPSSNLLWTNITAPSTTNDPSASRTTYYYMIR